MSCEFRCHFLTWCPGIQFSPHLQLSQGVLQSSVLTEKDQKTQYTSALGRNERIAVVEAPGEVEQQSSGCDLAAPQRAFSHGGMEISWLQRAPFGGSRSGESFA